MNLKKILRTGSIVGVVVLNFAQPLFGLYHNHQTERIKRFISDITIHKDGSMDVVESISVVSTGDMIRHGIVREFPTRYNDYAGTYYNVDFTLKLVSLDGLPVEHTIKMVSNGEKIYAGRADELLQPGEHTYRFHYTTNRQIGFFKDHDELFWNVNGTGWRLPIDYVQARIHFPPALKDLSIVSTNGFTGYQDEVGQDYKVQRTPDAIIFETTRPLKKYENLSIVVGWPKSDVPLAERKPADHYVMEPTTATYIGRFARDNWPIAWLLLGFVALLIFYRKRVSLASKDKQPGTIIPLFYPPDSLTPGAVSYMKERSFSDKALSADLVNLAVRGFIKIEYKKTFFGDHAYTLVATKDMEDDTWQEGATKVEIALMKTLFQDGSTIELASKNSAIISHAKKLLQADYKAKFGKYIYVDSFAITWGWIITVIAMIPAIALHESIVIWLAFAIFVIINLIVGAMLSSYTKEGRALQDKIDGFELFLSTTETERLKVVGTPPTKTPELYEHYLPYAMALNVEQAWTRQFTPIFASLEQAGKPYRPVWYPYGAFYGSGISSISNFSSALNASIAASSTPPGRSSGSGGGGSSGGGGGGGGGGGW